MNNEMAHASWHCSFEAGFYSNEDRAERDAFALVYELQAACIHESGHAVLEYALGLGASKVEVYVEGGKPMTAAKGLPAADWPRQLRVSSVVTNVFAEKSRKVGIQTPHSCKEWSWQLVPRLSGSTATSQACRVWGPRRTRCRREIAF